MKNKEKAENLVENMSHALQNIKSSVYRSDLSNMEVKFERAEDLLEKLRELISIQEDDLLRRQYSGI
jgi:hypothetical protein